MRHAYDYSLKLAARQAVIAEITRRFIKSVKRNWSLVEGYKRMRLGSPLRIDYDERRTILDIYIELPATRPVRYLVYISMQTSRPLSPSQTRTKILRLLERKTRYVTGMDTAKYILCPAGYTRGALEMLRTARIIPMKNMHEIIKNMAKYFKNRYTKLIDALRGKRLYGELMLLAYILREITKELGETIANDPLEQYLKYYPSPLILAEQGIEIPAPH
ncbi:hypothetical protein J4526_01890 [Desulfurococcaceae archaeon MEX13E-LK6-19]|nr:hypothetical protein J4526_01890 [Desulfurococcaceae archaeon MEX13E-LK6-19]